jgi:hypothetical protein
MTCATPSAPSRRPPRTRRRSRSAAASGIAAQLPGDAGTGLLAAAGDAFVSAMGIGLTVGGALAAVAALVVARFLPRSARRAATGAAHVASAEGARVADQPGMP